MRHIPTRPHRHRGRAGLLIGSVLLLSGWACSSDRVERKAPSPSAPPSLQPITIPLSINGEASQAITLELDSAGYTKELLGVPPPTIDSRWASWSAYSVHSAQLQISLAHYPAAKPALHRSIDGLIRAGLRSRATGEFIPGIVVTSPTLLSFADNAYLQQTSAEPATGLPILPYAGATIISLQAAALSSLTTYASASGKKKKIWWRLADTLQAADISLPTAAELVVSYRDDEGEPRELVLSAAMISEQPGSVLLKLNRRGKWKLEHHVGTETHSVRPTQLQIRGTADATQRPLGRKPVFDKL